MQIEKRGLRGDRRVESAFWRRGRRAGDAARVPGPAGGIASAQKGAVNRGRRRGRTHGTRTGRQRRSSHGLPAAPERPGVRNFGQPDQEPLVFPGMHRSSSNSRIGTEIRVREKLRWPTRGGEGPIKGLSLSAFDD